ncbi:MAG: hypothetical protein IJM94_03825 [Clostridia bacterium]|nr:hypothetical protein [Clostridia bacterium]MBQ9997532.1 hypothetical protein [Clostridia bacterium]
MNEKQAEIDKIIKKTSAKYLKKLEEKDNEIGRYKDALNSISNSFAQDKQFYTEKETPLADDEVISKVDEILNIPKEERSEQDAEKLSQYKDRYNNLMFEKDINAAKEWAKENYDGDIIEVLKNDEFIEFASGLQGDLPVIISKYLKLNSKQDDTRDIVTPGSAKDVSGVAQKQYFSKEEVSKMSPEQIKKYMGIIEKSIPKWSK